MFDKDSTIDPSNTMIESTEQFIKNNHFPKSNESVIENLLFEIYDKWSYKCRHDSSWDSDTFTSASDAIACLVWRKPMGNSFIGSEADQEQSKIVTESLLLQKSIPDLVKLRNEIQQLISQYSSRLVRQLRRKDHTLMKRQKNCDILTAILQASSLKRREDTKLKFVMDPKPGNEGFRQWVDAMKGVARLPLGLPIEIRKKVWLSLANNHITVQKYDWNRVIKFAFNEKSNPDDDSLGLQIVKDLHRTGCDTFTTDSEKAILKRVLLAYARWNKRVGYCQGFNVLAAIILDVMERNEEASLKVMVYLVDHILPESYFAQNLQALSIDMAVFRELLSVYVPKLSAHLNHLQTDTKISSSPNNSYYEPPLTNVFTMQWFLTLFATCLPPDIVLRIWDSIILEGSEIILRTGISIWEILSDRLLKVKNTDIFYCTMRDLTSQLLEGKIIQVEQLINRIYGMAPIPFQRLNTLRDKFTYNINPFSSTPNTMVSYGMIGSDTCEDDEDDLCDNKEGRTRSSIGCFGNMRYTIHAPHPKYKVSLPLSSVDISQVGPGAVSSGPHIHHVTSPGATQERMSTNLNALECQYNKIKDKQKRATLLMTDIGTDIVFAKSHIVTPRRKLSNSNIGKNEINSLESSIISTSYPTPQNLIVNHLLLTRSSTSISQNRSSLICQKRIKTSMSDFISIVSHKPCNSDLNKRNQNFFDFDQSKWSSSFQVPESTVSSVRQLSDCSSNRYQLQRSLSQSDLLWSGESESSPRIRSSSINGLRRSTMTLLQLSKCAEKDKISCKDTTEEEKNPFSPMSHLDLNAVLGRHHERIKRGLTELKYLESEKKVIKLFPGDELESPVEIGHTERWVAEHYLQNVRSISFDHFITPRQSSVTSSSSKYTYNPLFGTKAGFFKIMAQNRLSKSKTNGILHTAYTNEFQRSGLFQLVNCD